MPVSSGACTIPTPTRTFLRSAIYRGREWTRDLQSWKNNFRTLWPQKANMPILPFWPGTQQWQGKSLTNFKAGWICPSGLIPQNLLFLPTGLILPTTNSQDNELAELSGPAVVE